MVSVEVTKRRMVEDEAEEAGRAMIMNLVLILKAVGIF